jgi:hypothetical protein
MASDIFVPCFFAGYPIDFKRYTALKRFDRKALEARLI